jgi:sugar lactone lactonase YvrE
VKAWLAAALLLLGGASGRTGPTVVTVAGGGAGDGGPAASAHLGAAGELVVLESGDVLFVDPAHSSIRRIDVASRTISTVLRTEEREAPRSLAAGAPGKLLFGSDHRVEELDLATGRRRPIAGNGERLYRAETVAPGGPATQTRLGLVRGIAVDPRGGVCFGDAARGLILRVDPSTGILERLFEMEKALVSKGYEHARVVAGLAFDAAGVLYFSDERHYRVYRVEDGRAVAVAGTGERRQRFPGNPGPPGSDDSAAPATVSPLHDNGPLAFRPTGEVAIGGGFNLVQYVNRHGQLATLLGPTVQSGNVGGLGFDADGTLYATVTPPGKVAQVMRLPAGATEPEVIAGSGLPHCCGDGAKGREAVLSEPEGVAIDAGGDLLIADTGNHRVRRLSARTGRIETIAGGGTFALPGSRSVTGRPLRPAPPPGRIHGLFFEVLSPRFVAADAAGNAYFAQREGPVYRIEKRDGAVVALGTGRRNACGASSPDGFSAIGGIAVEPSGTVFVAAENRIWRISAEGRLGVLAGSGNEGFAGDGGFALRADVSRPAWPVVDGRGTLYFVDGGNLRIRRVDRNAVISTVAGNGLAFASGEGQATRESIGTVTGLALDSLGNLNYATSDNRIWRLSVADGQLRVVAGRDLGDPPSPDGPLAGVTKLGRPRALAFDGRGSLYFSEPDNSRVRAIRP